LVLGGGQQEEERAEEGQVVPRVLRYERSFFFFSFFFFVCLFGVYKQTGYSKEMETESWCWVVEPTQEEEREEEGQVVSSHKLNNKIKNRKHDKRVLRYERSFFFFFFFCLFVYLNEMETESWFWVAEPTQEEERAEEGQVVSSH
jgi:hypothetical protein